MAIFPYKCSECLCILAEAREDWDDRDKYHARECSRHPEYAAHMKAIDAELETMT
jgi:hypothetical protein